MKCASPRPVQLKITQFAMIDGAMCKMVKAAARYEKAIYTSGERDALDGLVKAAMDLKEAFITVATQINEAGGVIEDEIGVVDNS